MEERMSAHGFTQRAKAQRAELQVIKDMRGPASSLRIKQIEFKKKRNQTVVVGAVENWKTLVKPSFCNGLQLKTPADHGVGIVESQWFSTVSRFWGKQR